MINNIDLQHVKVMKILGVYLQADLKWNTHIDSICNKSNQRLYLLRKLKYFRVPADDLVTVYTCYIRPILEYASPVWHPGLTTKLSSRIEGVQRRALRVILGVHYTSYANACARLNLPTLGSRREGLTLNFAKSLEQSKLYRHLLPLSRADISGRTTRSSHKLDSVPCRTERYRSSAIPYMTRMLNVQ